MSTPAYQATRRKLRERVFTTPALVAEAVADAAHGADQLHRERIVDLGAQVPHVHVNDVGQTLEALVPHVLDDHGAREHPPRIGGQILEQRVLLGGELDARAARDAPAA